LGLAIRLAVLGAVMLPISQAAGFTWDETVDGGADAGQFVSTAQVVTGAGALTQITGVIPGPDDIDMYRISITSASTFSASCTGGFSFTPARLYLFDASGLGVSGYKDGANTGSLISDTFVVSPGVYHLALSGFSDPLVGVQSIWDVSGASDVERAPDGAGAAGQLDDWSPSIVPVAFDSYTITLTSAAQAPEPATMAILALGAIGILRKRKVGQR